jgi:uncharacterized membrane protein YeaQ/YmgE (transglycosylase-associated protein family)
MGIILSLIVSGLIIGALGRLAVPGPDPMPIWLTILIGIAGSFIGGMVAYAFTRSVALYFLFEVAAATLLVIGYRKYVQGRPITGPGARRLDR